MEKLYEEYSASRLQLVVAMGKCAALATATVNQIQLYVAANMPLAVVTFSSEIDEAPTRQKREELYVNRVENELAAHGSCYAAKDVDVLLTYVQQYNAARQDYKILRSCRVEMSYSMVAMARYLTVEVPEAVRKESDKLTVSHHADFLMADIEQFATPLGAPNGEPQNARMQKIYAALIAIPKMTNDIMIALAKMQSGQTLAEIGEILNIDKATVEEHYSLGIKKLAKYDTTKMPMPLYDLEIDAMNWLLTARVPNKKPVKNKKPIEQVFDFAPLWM